MNLLPSSSIRKTLFLLAGLLAVLWGLYAYQETWCAFVLRATIDRLAVKHLGQHVSVGRISGNFLDNLVLEDIRSEAAPAATIAASVKLRRLEASYRLSDLLHGVPAFLEHLVLLAEAPEVVITTSDKAEIDKSVHPFVLPSWLPLLQVREGSIVWRQGEVTVNSQGVALRLTRPDNRQNPYLLDLTMSELQLTTPSVTWSGPVAAKAAASATAITVQDLRLGDDLRVSSAHLQWPGTAKENAALALELTLFDGRITASCNGQGKLWRGSLALTGINLARLAGRLPALLRTGILAGEVSFRGDLTQSKSWQGAASLSLSQGGERLLLEASLAEDRLRVERLVAELGANQVKVEQVSLPLPALRDRHGLDLLRQAEGSFSLRLNDIPALLGRLMATPLPAPPSGGYPAHRLLATGQFHGAQALIEQFDLTTARNRLIGKDIALKLPADPNGALLEASLQAKGVVQIDDLGELGAIFGQPAMAGQLQGQLSVTGPLRSLLGELVLTGSNLDLHGVVIDSIDVQARAEHNGVLQGECRLLRGHDRLVLRGGFDRKSQEISALDLDLSLGDPAAYAGIAPWLRDIRGDLRATVKGNGPIAAPQLKLELMAHELNFRGRALGNLRLEANTMAKDVLAYSADVERQPMALHTTGEVNLDRKKGRVIIAMRTFTLEGHQPWLELDHPADLTIAWAGGARIAVEQLLLRGPIGSLLVDGTAGEQADTAMLVVIKDLRGGDWLALVDERLRLEGGNLAAEMRGSWRAPVVHVSGSVGRFGESGQDVDLAGEFEVSLGPDSIVVHRCQWGDGHGARLTLSGTMPANLLLAQSLPRSRWDLKAALVLPDLRVLSPFLPATMPLQGAVQGEAQLEGEWQAPSGRLRFTGTNLRPRDFMPQAPPGLFTAEMKVNFDQDRISLAPIALNGDNLTLRCQGEMVGLPIWSKIVAGTADWSDSRLDLKASFATPDLGWLAAEANGLREVKGQLRGDVTMTGTPTKPVLGGQVQLTGGELRFDVNMPPFKAITASATLAGRVIQFQTITGALGGAPIQGSGLIDFAPLDGPYLVLDLKGQDLLFYRQEGLKVRADADLHAKGPLTHLEISGDLAMADGQWTRNFNFLSLLPGRSEPGVVQDLPLFSLRKSPWNAMRFNVRGKTRNPFEVRNNIVRATLRPDLMLTGTGEAPVLTGVIYLDPSRIDMPAGKIMLNSGVLHFVEKAPARPDLEVAGQARMMGYDINLTISGTTAEPVITLAATPPLPEDQLLMLLLAGQAPPAGAANTSGRRQGVMTAAVYLGQGFLTSIMGDRAGEPKESVLERFELAIGRDVSRKGDETLDAQFRLLDLREKEAASMYLTGGRDMYDYFNLGLKIVFRFQ